MADFKIGRRVLPVAGCRGDGGGEGERGYQQSDPYEGRSLPQLQHGHTHLWRPKPMAPLQYQVQFLYRTNSVSLSLSLSLWSLSLHMESLFIRSRWLGLLLAVFLPSQSPFSHSVLSLSLFPLSPLSLSFPTLPLSLSLSPSLPKLSSLPLPLSLSLSL